MEILRFGPDDRTELARVRRGHQRRPRRGLAVAAPGDAARARTAGSATAGTARSRRRSSGSSTASRSRSGTVATSEYDNLHLAWLGVQVHPDHRRRGHGIAMLEALVAETRARGRTRSAPTAGTSEATRGFAARHGLEEKSRAIQRRQLLAELDWAGLERLHAEARGRGVGVRARPPRGPHARRRARRRWPR